MKKSLKRSSFAVGQAAAILAGGLMFTGDVSAAVLFSESFEGASNAFGMPTYQYSQNYTAPSALVPAGGLKYAHGDRGISGAASTNLFPTSAALRLPFDFGITPEASIDGGMAEYVLYGQFSTYLTQGDWASVTINFFDDNDQALGSSVTIGGQAFTAPLMSGAGAAWAADQITGMVPAGARYLEMRITETKTPGGTVIDGYLDNVSVSMSVVPEPTAAVLLSGGLLLAGRRRKQ